MYSDNGLIIKHKELIDQDIQHLGDGEEGVERDGLLDVGASPWPMKTAKRSIFSVNVSWVKPFRLR